MKNTLRQVFHSSKFLVGFIIFLLILLTMWVYPFLNPGNPLEMIGVGTFARPGTYFSLYDAVNTPAETLRLSDADDKRVAASMSMEDRVAMVEWFTLAEVDIEGLDINDTDALLDLWFANYDSSLKLKGMTNAKKNYYKRLDRSIREIRAADTFTLMHPDEDSGELVKRSDISKTDYINVGQAPAARHRQLRARCAEGACLRHGDFHCDRPYCRHCGYIHRVIPWSAGRLCGRLSGRYYHVHHEHIYRYSKLCTADSHLLLYRPGSARCERCGYCHRLHELDLDGKVGAFTGYQPA